MTNKEYEERQKKIDKDYEDFGLMISYFFLLIILTPSFGLLVGYLIKTFLL